MGREVTGLLLKDESQPTMADNVGVSGYRAPVHFDISVSKNLALLQGPAGRVPR